MCRNTIYDSHTTTLIVSESVIVLVICEVRIIALNYALLMHLRVSFLSFNSSYHSFFSLWHTLYRDFKLLLKLDFIYSPRILFNKKFTEGFF